MMSVATQKELQELNISLLLNPASWIEGMNDEADFDVLNLNEYVKLAFRKVTSYDPKPYGVSVSVVPIPRCLDIRTTDI